ncbi:MAG TPA: UDP-N-acetylglucosamine 2-epimerase (non-hydrolyzing) [Vicinamibacterales bacterium]|nr:UDP-N-acetylglucosamine 2-epimerase (non-hydrolyzing) [Vicinamibacterales bacterium]
MRKLKVMTIVGTRPELIKLSRVLAELDRRTRHVLVHTGQNFDYELNGIFFRELEIRRPDYFLKAAGPSAVGTISRVLTSADEVLAKERPEAVLIYGDTNSCLAAIAAKRRRIPVFHLEAGNRCFDQRVPEEINRKIIDHISDINMPLTEQARQYLLAEGLRPETIIKVGSAMPEILEYYRPGIEQCQVLDRMKLTAGEYFVVSAHREENVDDQDRLRGLLTTLDQLAREYRRRIVMSTHPRTRRRLASLARSSKGLKRNRIEFLKPFGFFDWVTLQANAACVLSDSGTLTEEAALLGFPSVMIRDAHERPEGMDAGVTIMSGLAPERVLQAVALAIAQGRPSTGPPMVADYAALDVSRKVVRIILSYVDYVQRTTWFRRGE